MAQDSDTQKAVVAHVISQIWTDPSFKTQFLADPRGTLNTALTAAGLQAIPAGTTVTVLQDTASTRNYVLPPAGSPDSSTIANAVNKIVASLPSGITGKVTQQASDADQYFVIPIPPPGMSLANLSTRDVELVAAASGSVAVNTTVVANVYVAANLEGVQNAVGATEAAGVAIAVVAGVLT